jgi:hypothetical protein
MKQENLIKILEILLMKKMFKNFFYIYQIN